MGEFVVGLSKRAWARFQQALRDRKPGDPPPKPPQPTVLRVVPGRKSPDDTT